MIDLRSDTITRPTSDMWDAMHKVPVGDDVFREDPCVNKFEEKVANLFGMESGLFVPSGTMGNQLGIKIHTQPADEVIIEHQAHIYHSEGAAAGLISGIQLRPLCGDRGLLTAEQVDDAVRDHTDWNPRSRLVTLENSANMGGGSCYSLQQIRDIYNVTRTHGLALHIDGARIWNAAVATGTELAQYGKACDTISVCFSKALGAPVGSMLLGSRTLIDQARRYRKLLGGGMRQAGMLAAAASYAVDHHFEGLKNDHRRAAIMAKYLEASPFFEINSGEVETNIVLFRIFRGAEKEVLKIFSDNDIAMIPFGKDMIRAVFHYEITDTDLDKVISVIQHFHLG